jgi:PAS domain S-box-containing protein
MQSKTRSHPTRVEPSTRTQTSAKTTAHSQDGIWIIDSDASTLYANAAMAAILGVDPSELAGQPSFSYIFPEDVDAARQLFESKQQGDAAPFPFRLRRKDGSAIWVDIQGTPMHNSTGDFLGIVGTFRISDRQS